MNFSTIFGGTIPMSTAAAPAASPVAAVAPTAAGGSWWNTITGGITQISNIATQVYGVKTQLQNLKNAQAAQPQPMAQIPYIAPNAPAQYAPSTAAAPANHTMLYIGGAIVVALAGFLMMRRK